MPSRFRISATALATFMGTLLGVRRCSPDCGTKDALGANSQRAARSGSREIAPCSTAISGEKIKCGPEIDRIIEDKLFYFSRFRTKSGGIEQGGILAANRGRIRLTGGKQ